MKHSVSFSRTLLKHCLSFSLSLLLGTVHGTQVRATALLHRAATQAGGALLPLRVAESLQGSQTVVYLTGSLPVAERTSHEWRTWCTREWECCAVRAKYTQVGGRRVLAGSTQTSLHVASRGPPEADEDADAAIKRRVYFCSLLMARQLAAELDGAPVDLLVVDTTSVHPRAAPRLQAITRQASNDGLFRAARLLFLRPDEADPAAAATLAKGAVEADGRGGEGELCVVSALGASCLDGLESAADAESAAAARERARHGPVARRLAAPSAPPKLAIVADGPGLLVLSAAEAHAALERAAPAGSRLPEPADSPTAPGAHLVELALAVLYIFFVSL